MSYESAMILKNLLLFFSGCLFAGITISLIAAYYMMHSEITDEIEENIIFSDVPEAKLLWKHPKTFLTALEMQYALIYWHFTNSQRKSLQSNLKRGRIILISILILFIILLLVSLIGSFNINFQPNLPPPKC